MFCFDHCAGAIKLYTCSVMYVRSRDPCGMECVCNFAKFISVLKCTNISPGGRKEL